MASKGEIDKRYIDVIGRDKMKEFLLTIFSLVSGYFIGKHQERSRSKENIKKLKSTLFLLVSDLDSRRQEDLEEINRAFICVVLTERGLSDGKCINDISFPRKIEIKAIEDTFYQVVSELPLGLREGMRVLLESANSFNDQIDFINQRLTRGSGLSIDSLITIHCQSILYGYIVQQINILHDRFVLPDMDRQEILEIAAHAFKINLHIDDIIAENAR